MSKIYDYYEEWMLYLKDGDKLIQNGLIKIFKNYSNPTYINNKISPPGIGQALFFNAHEEGLKISYNLNYWKPLKRKEKLERILNE